MESEDVVDLMEIMEEDNTADYEPPSPSPDPMAGIGYWESPGNSPKPARKCMTGEGDHVDPEEDFAHQRSRRLLEEHNSAITGDSVPTAISGYNQRRCRRPDPSNIPEGKFIVEVGLNERGLVTIPTKALNKLMKDNNVSKEDRKRIKERRRTLLNRGYAADIRRTRIDGEEALKMQIANHTKKLEVMEREKGQLRRDLEHLKLKLDSDESETTEWRETLEEFEDLIQPHELERPELMLPGQTRPDIPVSWMMKRMKLKVTLKSKGRKSCR